MASGRAVCQKSACRGIWNAGGHGFVKISRLRDGCMVEETSAGLTACGDRCGKKEYGKQCVFSHCLWSVLCFMIDIKDFFHSYPDTKTDRLRLRPFTETDTDAVFALLSDRETNRFLPWFPCETKKGAVSFLRERILGAKGGFVAVCLGETDIPIGYVSVGADESHDFGYALRREFWGYGLMTEAARAVMEQLRKAGVPYLTATHDVKNPASGAVMKTLGMTYRYSYRELWQPKDVSVIFRMYQIDFVKGDLTYMGYWDRYPEHWVEQPFREEEKIVLPKNGGGEEHGDS